MHIGLLADRGRVAELARHGREDVLRGVAAAVRGDPARLAGQPRQFERLHRAVPGAEVLRGEALAAQALLALDRLAEVVVDVGRRDAVRFAVLAHVLEQRLPRQLLAAAHDLRHARVLERGLVHHAALAAKAQPQRLALHRRMPVAQRGQAVGTVAARVLLVAHAHQRGVEQPHQRGQHLRPGRRARALAGLQVALHPRADARQRAREGLEPVELGLVLQRAPVGVVAVLLAAARIEARGLQVAVGQRADPHLVVGRRYRQHADARELVRVAHPLAARVAVAKLRAVPQAPDARHVGVHVDQPVRDRRGLGRRPSRGGCCVRHGGCVV